MIPYMTEDTVQFVTNSEYNEWVVKLLSPPEERTMSDSLLETLSVIAYRQPVTRADIESVRGVRCEYSVTQLLKQGLIVELGRKDCIGRPMQFGTTDAFLRKFGLSSLRDLPPLPIREDDEISQTSDRELPANTSSQADSADNGGGMRRLNLRIISFFHQYTGFVAIFDGCACNSACNFVPFVVKCAC